MRGFDIDNFLPGSFVIRGRRGRFALGGMLPQLRGTGNAGRTIR
jgi:hypothetical protein